MTLEQQIKDWERIGRLNIEVRECPQEFRERKKREFWEALRTYYINYGIKFDYFKKPE